MLLKTNRTYISNVINNEFKTSFSDFVNKYRIDEAKELMVEKKSSKYTLEYISEMVGFGSLHTFIRVFKKMEGKTPSIFKKENNFRVIEFFNNSQFRNVFFYLLDVLFLNTSHRWNIY